MNCILLAKYLPHTHAIEWFDCIFYIVYALSRIVIHIRYILSLLSLSFESVFFFDSVLIRYYCSDDVLRRCIVCVLSFLFSLKKKCYLLLRRITIIVDKI